MSENSIHDFEALQLSKDVMPVLFVGHGSPLNALENNEFSGNWWAIGQSLPTPRAILSVSAHWLTHGTAVTAMEQPRTIHDFWGFPETLHSFEYPARGAPVLARSIADLIGGTTVTLDKDWGLDHGTWVVLARMFPSAEVPVLQLSIDRTQPAAFHYALGQELADLRKRGVLIMGSGNIVHNLAMANPAVERYDWAEEFDATVAERLLEDDHQSLIDYEKLGRPARLAIPTNDHYLPLLYAIGAGGPQDRIALFSERIVYGSISMRCLLLY